MMMLSLDQKLICILVLAVILIAICMTTSAYTEAKDLEKWINELLNRSNDDEPSSSIH